MQLASMILLYILHESTKEHEKYGAKLNADTDKSLGMDMISASQLIYLLMFIEAVLSWFFALIKEWDISKRGEANEYGIETTFCSRVLDGVSLFIKITIGILAVVHLVAMGDKMHEWPIINYYIIANCCIMILMMPYELIAKRMLVDTEISKNIYTLYQVQKRKLRDRRAQVKAESVKLYKRFFKDEEAKKEAEAKPDEKKAKVKPGFFFKSIGDVEKPKKKKITSTADDISKRLNDQIQKEERDDETSESDDEETTTSSDEDSEIKKQSRQEIVVKELDFAMNQELKFQADVYSFTVCANMTKCCSPLQQGFALK